MAIAIGLAVACFVLLLRPLTPVEWAEHRLDDCLFRLRRPHPPHAAIRLVLLDRKTDQMLKIPRIFWTPLYAKAMHAMLEAGARVVGLDSVVEYPSSMESDSDRQLILPFADLAANYHDRVVLIAYLQDNGGDNTPTVDPPCPPLQALIGDDNIALANLTYDRDGVLRRQQVSAIQSLGRGWPFFPRLLADRYLGHPATTDDMIGINYTDAACTFPTMSFADVLQQANRPDHLRAFFQDSVVLVGPGPGWQDLAVTPFSNPFLSEDRGQDVLGVQAQAEVLSTLLTRDPIRPASEPLAWAVVIAWCMLLAALAMRLQAVPALAATVLLLLLWGGLAFLAFDRGRLMLQQVPMLLSPALVLGAVYAWRERGEFVEKRRIKALFGRQVSADVMETLLQRSSQLVGSFGTQTVTVLFSDINGFSTMCETEPPEVSIDMLNHYY
ncbi:MAG: CHASE2 domain-containing protein, partial [Candidatus Xenobia bacterium]